MFDGELIVCRNVESAVLANPIDKVWKFLKSLDFAKLFPHTVAACHLLVPLAAASAAGKSEGEVEFGGERMALQAVPEAVAEPTTVATAVGSVRRVQYKDGAVFTYKLAEISDLRHSVSFELIEANPSIQVSGILHTVKLVEISETSETLIIWDSEFSGDCNYNFYQDQKWKKLDAFKSMRQAALAASL